MNNEEKNLPENGEVNTEIKEEKAKKLPLGALIGIIAGAVAVVVAIILLIVLLPGNKCDGHIDADDDYICDKCGEHYDDGDEQPDNPTPDVVTADVTFTVKLDSGEVLSGIKFTLTRGEKSYALVSGSDGSIKQTIEIGAYSISYDESTVPQYCTPDTFGVRIEEGTSDILLTITNNIPDGSEKKPFFISENETDITLAPGDEFYFNYRGSSVKTVTINENGVSITYNGETYSAEDGSVSVVLSPEIGTLTLFSVKNTSDSEISTVMHLIAPLGSSENPIEMTENSSVASVNPEQIVYYEWTANMDGVVVLTSDTVGNSITITRILENDVSIISQTGGSGVAYLAVSNGETVTIGVSVLESSSSDTEGPVSVDFLLTVYAGTEDDPVPVLTDDISISLAPGASIAFRSEAGKTLSITDESTVWVSHNGNFYNNENGFEIDFELTDSIVFVENKSDHINGITLRFE